MCFTKWGHPPIGCCSTVLANLLGKTGVSAFFVGAKNMFHFVNWLELIKNNNNNIMGMMIKKLLTLNKILHHCLKVFFSHLILLRR